MNNINRFEYDMKAEKNVSVVLPHFNSEYIMSVVDGALVRRLTSYMPALPNIMDATERHYSMAVQSGTLDEEEVEELDQARVIIYEQTINKLCSNHNLEFNSTMELDPYTASRILYDFLISNYKNYIVSFFSHYIDENQNEIYQALGLDKFKKDKDSSVMYGKISYDNQIITTITSNIEHVLYNMQSFDISLDDILHAVYDVNTANFISSIIASDTFYRDVYMNTVLNEVYGPLVKTDIRLMLHNVQNPQVVDAYEK